MNKTKIYLVTNCYGDSNKVYIGKEKTNKSKYNTRKYDHKKRFGENIVFTFIDKINSLDSKNWKPLEQYWIEQFRQWGFDIQNRNKGGGGPNKLSNKQIKKLKKPILQYNLVGNFVKEWESLKDISNHLKIKSSAEISRCCRGERRQVKGFIFKFKTKNFKKIIKITPKTNLNRKKVIQLDLNNNFIKEWNSAQEASININKKFSSTIASCCNQNTKTALGYKWRWK